MDVLDCSIKYLGWNQRTLQDICLCVERILDSVVLPGAEECGKVPVDVPAGGIPDLLEVSFPHLRYLLQELHGFGHALDLRERGGEGCFVLLELLRHQLPGILGLLH